MRFLFFDRVTGISRGRFIEGVKTFNLSEEFLGRHYGKVALVPGVMLIEAMAQLLGWLVVYSNDFGISPVMSLIEGAETSSELRPGFTAEMRGEIVSCSGRDSLGLAEAFCGGRRIASIERVIYSHVSLAEAEAMRARFSYYSGIPVEELRGGGE